MKLILVAVAVALLAVLGGAFHLGDHEGITLQALKEYGACFPKSTLLPQVDTIVKANKNEDINLWDKWVKGYAHFYNPYHQVKVCKFGFCRKSSDVRVEMLAEDLMNKTTDNWAGTVGAVTHHMQDMNSPPHVVPVMHDLKDGFESFHNSHYPALNTSCTALNAMYNVVAAISKNVLFALLNKTSIATLNKIKTSVNYTADGKSVSGSWTALFWQNAKVDENNFGTYGLLDNNFGSASFKVDNHAYTFDANNFEIFKRQQLRAAIDCTKIIFLYADRLQNKTLAP